MQWIGRHKQELEQSTIKYTCTRKRKHAYSLHISKTVVTRTGWTVAQFCPGKESLPPTRKAHTSCKVKSEQKCSCKGTGSTPAYQKTGPPRFRPCESSSESCSTRALELSMCTASQHSQSATPNTEQQPQSLSPLHISANSIVSLTACPIASWSYTPPCTTT